MAAYKGRPSRRHLSSVPTVSSRPGPQYLPSPYSSSPPCIVKVENLAKITTELDLVDRLRGFTFVSTSIIQCPEAPVNYAYLNCTDPTTAQRVVDYINGKILLHNNLLKAKLKSQQYHSSSDSSSPPCTVKVENLAKVTTEADLVDRLEDFSFVSLSVIHCTGALVNYAYLNCVDSTTAQNVVDKIDGKMLLHTNLLTAKLKSQGKRSRNVRGGSNAAHPKNICAVKVLVQDFHLTGADLDEHFMQYGELASRTIIRQAHQLFAFVNFVDPSSAQEARSNPSHTVKGKSVVAVPFTSFKDGPPINPAQDLVTLELHCDPLVLPQTRKEIAQEFQYQEMMSINAKGDKFIIHVPGATAESIKKKIQETIKTQEANLESKDIELHFHYLPLLADQDVQKQIQEIKIPFELKVSKGPDKVELDKLKFDYRRKGPLEEETILKQYLKSSTGAVGCETKCRWYWFDEVLFQPYTERISERIERTYRLKKSLEVHVDKYEYLIDTSQMTQTNKSTHKIRQIQRKPVHSSEETSHVTLHIRAHEVHIQELCREIKDILSKLVHEAKVMLPDITTGANPFSTLLLETATSNLVKATLVEDGIAVILLQGKEITVKSTEVEIQKEILKKEREVEKFTKSSLPSHWEPQVSKCELKSVKKRSPEWKEIQDKMQRSDFKPEIVDIQRIQNTWLWEGYQTSRKRMSDKNDGKVNEKKLFHGPRQTRPKDIYDSEQGFDHRLASKGLWGEGTYFAAESKYSDRYAVPLPDGSKQLFMVNVITGISCEYKTDDRTLKAPPKKTEHRARAAASRRSIAAKFEGERYDSVTAHTNGSQVYVIYELGRVYPAYLITYNTHTHDMDFLN